MAPVKVGMREFRQALAKFLYSAAPVAVTRHDRVVGYFVPTPGPSDADLAALAEAGRTIARMLEERDVEPGEIVAEFDAARRKARPPPRPK